MIEPLFKLSENKTNGRTEALAGVTTFLTMAYIIFVQPAVLSGKMLGTNTGVDFDAASPSLKNGIAAGIGLFIAFIGLQQAGVILKDPGTAVKLNAHLASPDLIVFFVGMLTTAILHARRARGSILWGIIAATALACVLKFALPHMPAGISSARDVSESML